MGTTRLERVTDVGDIFVRLVETLPSTVQGFTIADEDGNYNVYLNAKLSREQQQEVYQHEVEHIHGDDFAHDADDSVAQIEQDCRSRLDSQDQKV